MSDLQELEELKRLEYLESLAAKSGIAPSWANDRLARMYSAPQNLGVTNSQEIPRETPTAPTDIVRNVALGLSASGNKAMTAMNPMATQDDYNRLKKEQAWVDQNTGAGAGQFVGDLINYLPSSLPGNLPARAVASGITSALTTPGELSERESAFSSGALGSAVGEKVGQGLAKVVQPFASKTSSYYDDLVGLADKYGIKLGADQVTNNKTLRKTANVLDTLPISSGMRSEFKDAQREAWQRALFKQGGENAAQATPTNMGFMKDRISGVYKELTDKYDLVVDKQLKSTLDDISNKYLARIPATQKSVVKKYIEDFSSKQPGKVIAGNVYQDTRSLLDKQAKSFAKSDPASSEALREVRSAIDSAMERSIVKGGNIVTNPEGFMDLERWKKANKDWSVMRSIEDAINTGDNLAEGKINPNAFIRNMKKRDPNRLVYGKGDQELADLARVGQAFIPDKDIGSDTAQKQVLTKLITGDLLLGSGAGLLAQDPLTGLATIGLAAVPSLTLPPLLTMPLQKTGGYLSKGLIDLNKEVLPGLTKRRILTEVPRILGSRTASQASNREK